MTLAGLLVIADGGVSTAALARFPFKPRQAAEAKVDVVCKPRTSRSEAATRPT